MSGPNHPHQLNAYIVIVAQLLFSTREEKYTWQIYVLTTTSLCPRLLRVSSLQDHQINYSKPLLYKRDSLRHWHRCEGFGDNISVPTIYSWSICYKLLLGSKHSNTFLKYFSKDARFEAFVRLQ